MTNPADYQTDPAWAEKMKLGTVPASYIDGRHARSTTTKRDILAACRRLMMDGNFRPAMADVCGLAKRSVRSGHEHFHTIEALHLTAIEDVTTRDLVLGLLMDSTLAAAEEANVIRAIITGRIEP